MSKPRAPKCDSDLTERFQAWWESRVKDYGNRPVNFTSTKTRCAQSVPGFAPVATKRAFSLRGRPYSLFPVLLRAENLRIENVLALARLHLALDHPRLGHRLLRIDVRDRVPVRRVPLPPRRTGTR